MTADYKANPRGYYDNRWWPGGSEAILAGLLVGALALFVGRKRGNKNLPSLNEITSSIPPYPHAHHTFSAPPRAFS